MEHKINIIGISGKQGNGKTTLANHIINNNKKYVKVSFAENVRHIVSLITGINIDNLRSMKDKEYLYEPYNLTIRQLLQKVGTEMGRNIHPDVWTNSLFLNFNHNCYWIIDDVRFENEFNIIKKYGGIVIRLNKSNHIDDQHLSETALDHIDNWDLVINVDDYQNNVKGIYELVEKLL